MPDVISQYNENTVNWGSISLLYAPPLLIACLYLCSCLFGTSWKKIMGTVSDNVKHVFEDF